MELTHGYNNATGEYELSMIASDSTGMIIMKGKRDDKTGEITFDGPYWDVTVKDHIGWRAVVTPVKDGKSVTKLFADYGKGWDSMGTITYTRVENKADDAAKPAGK
jgi:hypothetical protein